MSDTPPSDDRLQLRAIAMPADTNYNGDIFGGWLLSQMDLAGSNFALQMAHGRVATIGLTAMNFHNPVYVGDEVSCYCNLVQVGKTSITVHVETWVRRHHDGTSIKVTEGTFTFVAIDEHGRKRPLPQHE